MARSNPVSDVLQFTIGGCLFGGGLFLFLNQVMVHPHMQGGGYRYGWGRPGWGGASLLPWGTPGVGLLMIPLGIDVCLLLAGTRERRAKLLVWGSLAAVAVGVLNNIRFSFVPSTLWQLAVYVVMIASGGGLMFRSLGRYADDSPRQTTPAAADDQQALRQELEELRQRLDGLNR